MEFFWSVFRKSQSPREDKAAPGRGIKAADMRGLLARRLPPRALPGKIEPEIYKVPVLVTRLCPPDTPLEGQDDWSAVDQLVARINRAFSPARVQLSVVESYHCPYPGEEVPGCPFAADLDHRLDWLHLVFLPRLAQPLPLLIECGRCCLIPDDCDDRQAIQAVAQMLGLVILEEGSEERLMSPGGSGDHLDEEERTCLRGWAGRMVGKAMALKAIVVPVWGFQVETPVDYRCQRGEAELRQWLEAVNGIWQQAGIAFQLANWGHIRQHQVTAPVWERIFKTTLPENAAHLSPLVECGTTALHLVLIGGPAPPRVLATDPKLRIALVHDAMQNPRTLAYAFGCLLGLPAVASQEQLMARRGEGQRLSPREVTQARERAEKLLRNPPFKKPLPAILTRAPLLPPSPPSLTVPIRLHLVRGPIGSKKTRQEATQWVERSNGIFAPAGIALRVAQLSEPLFPEGTLDAAWPTGASCAALQAVATPNAVNVFVVARLPENGPGYAAHQIWRSDNILLVAEDFTGHSQAKQLALSLACFWGLKTQIQGPTDMLASWQAPGTRLSPAEIEQLRLAIKKAPGTS